jgi:hypothetical protein
VTLYTYINGQYTPLVYDTKRKAWVIPTPVKP